MRICVSAEMLTNVTLKIGALIATLFLIGGDRPACAEDGLVFVDPTWHFVSRSDGFEIKIDDQIEDGCWARPQASETSVSLELIRNGFSVYESGSDEAAFAPTVWIEGLGYATSQGLCVVNVSMQIIALDTRQVSPDDSDGEVYAVYPSSIWSSNFVLSGPKSNMTSRISEVHAELTRDFLLQLATNGNQVRDEILTTVPENRKPEWRSYLSE